MPPLCFYLGAWLFCFSCVAVVGESIGSSFGLVRLEYGSGLSMEANGWRDVASVEAQAAMLAPCAIYL